MCLNGMCLKIRTSTCFLHGSRASNSSAFERNYCRTALLTCLYFAFICGSYTKHTFMVDLIGFEPTCCIPACKAGDFDHSYHRPIKSVSLTRVVCKQASWRLVSKSSLLAHYNDLAVHALPWNRTISRRRNLTVVHIVIALKQIVTNLLF